MTYIGYRYTSLRSAPSLPAGTQAGDFVVILIYPASSATPQNAWLRRLGNTNAWAGVFPGGANTITLSYPTASLIIVYRPGNEETISATAAQNTTSGLAHATPSIDLPATGQVWAMLSNTNDYGYLFQVSGSPQKNTNPAYIRLGGGDLSPGTYSVSATTSASTASQNLIVAVYAATTKAGADSAQLSEAAQVGLSSGDTGAVVESALLTVRLATGDKASASESARLRVPVAESGALLEDIWSARAGQETAGAQDRAVVYDITPFVPWYEGHYRVGWRVEIWGGSAWVDISGDLHGLEVEDDIDAPGPRVSLLLDRERWHPETSLLQLGAPVRVFGALGPADGSTMTEWPLARGRVGAIDAAGAQMRVEIYDRSEELLSRWIESEWAYTSPATLESRIQSILGNAVPDLGITLRVPTPTGMVVREQRLSVQPVWNAIEDLAALRGAKIRWLYDESAGDWRLTLYIPPRNKATPDHLLPPSTWLRIGQLRRGLEDVRNVVQVVYGSPANRTTLTVQDNASIGKYGRRWARISEASDSPINTFTEASALANAILSDLREPVAQVQVELHWAPFLRLHDLVELQPDGNALKSSLRVAVVSVRHSLRREMARTIITGRSSNPPGYYRYWLSREAGRRAQAPGVPPNASRPPAPSTAAPTLTLQAQALGLRLLWTPEYDPGYDHTEVQLSTSNYFSGNSTSSYRVRGSTLIVSTWQDGTPIPSGTTVYARVRHVYDDGRTSPWSSTASATMKAVESEDIASRAIKATHMDALWTPDLPGTFSPPTSNGTALWGVGLEVYQSNALKLRAGDISGLPFRGSTLPPGTFGLWAPDGYIAVGGGQDSYTAQSSQYAIPNATFSNVPGASITFELKVPSVVLLWYHAEAEGVVDISSVQSGSYANAGIYIEARLTTTNTGGGVLNGLHVDSIRRVGLSQTLYASSPRFQLRPQGTLAWARLYTLPAGTYTIQLQALRLILAGSGVTASGAGYLYGRGVGALIVR